MAEGRRAEATAAEEGAGLYRGVGATRYVREGEALLAASAEPLIQTGSPVASPRPCSALSGFPRTTISQPRASTMTPYSPGAKSAYVSPRVASAEPEAASTLSFALLSSPACSEVPFARV